MQSNALQPLHVGVIGAGNMGSGIALKYASSGFKVSLVDRTSICIERGKHSMERSLNLGLSRGQFHPDQVRQIIDNMSFSTDISQVNNASLVIEAIFEDLFEKRALISSLDEHCHKDTIIGSNTSSLLISDMQQGLKHKGRVLGLHYFFPAAKNRLVELIAGRDTEEDYLIQALQIQEKIQKVVIKAKDSPGFIVNRFFVPWLNEAMRIVHEGQANMASVDHACRSFYQTRLGPFALMNATGLPITLHACNSLALALGDFYAPCPLIRTPLERGQNWNIDNEIDEGISQAIIDRMMSVAFRICEELVHSEGVGSEKDVDIGARVGLAWAKGPFEQMKP